MKACEIHLWGTLIGAIAWDPDARVGRFRYHEAFLASGVELAPLKLPLGPGTFAFPELARTSFEGLPGLVADALPDTFGHAVIDAWLRTQGRPPGSLNPVERLAYTGERGMGALEFRPSMELVQGEPSEELELAALIALANETLRARRGLDTTLDGEDPRGLRQLLRVGTSAGGARAKAVVAWNPATGQLRSGQTELAPGFEHWLIKFDGVAENRDKELADPLGFGLVELAYARMATAAGITMTACRTFDEGGRHHFMTHRFDRVSGTGKDGAARTQKLHMASLAGLAHFDYNRAGAYSYEQAFDVGRALGLGADEQAELFRRMAFNVFARNQDDHVKNIAYLMDRRGTWRLAPAFDLTYSYNPEGAWTSTHQMSLAGKRDGFVVDDLMEVARHADLKPAKARAILGEVHAAVAEWPRFAEEAGVKADWIPEIGATHRLGLTVSA